MGVWVIKNYILILEGTDPSKSDGQAGFLEGQTLQKVTGKLRVVRVVEEGLVSGHGGLLEKAEV